MANVITFLKNYGNFGWKIRQITSQVYLTTLLTSSDKQVKKVMMVRIAEELVSSTEDLAMWLAAMGSRMVQNKRYRDEWEYLLGCKVNDESVSKVLREFARCKTADGLLKKFKLPPTSILLEFLKTDEESLMRLLEKMLETTKVSLKNRKVERGLLLRFHNKVKHGMAVEDDTGLFVRDRQQKVSKKGKFITRNRNIVLRLDEDKAKKMVGTIETNANMVKFISSLLLSDYAYKLRTYRRKLGKRQIRFWEEALKPQPS